MQEGEARRRFPIHWLVLTTLGALLAGAVGGGGAVLVLDRSDAVAGRNADANVEHRVLTTEENAVSDAVTRALPAVVTVVNDQPGGLVTGSGVIVDERGFVLTNEHVIRNPGKLTVILANGDIRSATPVSDDAPFNDIAIIRIPAGNLQALKFGDSDQLKPGQTVIAVGSPLFEFRNSVSVGVVSGLGRKYLHDNIFYQDLIQTDAAVNIGNSGGPLINTQAEVVGINTTVVRKTGNQDTIFGIAFAVSSKTVAPIVDSIIQRGQYTRPYFGIDHLDIDANVAQAAHLVLDHGAIVRRVTNPSPAQAAGLQAGDIILKVGERTLGEDTPFLNAIAILKPGDKVNVQYSRGGRLQETLITITAR
jgi:S1-C subfamily serine protease